MLAYVFSSSFLRCLFISGFSVRKQKKNAEEKKSWPITSLLLVEQNLPYPIRSRTSTGALPFNDGDPVTARAVTAPEPRPPFKLLVLLRLAPAFNHAFHSVQNY